MARVRKCNLKWNNEFEINGNVSTGLKLIKRSEKIRDNKLLNQLCLIPGVSSKIADTIMTSVKSIKELIQIYIDLADELACEAYFAEMVINGGTRKIGPSLSKKIYEYFCKE